MKSCDVPYGFVESSRALDTIKPLVPRVYIPTFVSSFGQGMLVPTLPLFVAELVRDRTSSDVNFTLVTLAVAMAGIGTMISNVPCGVLLSRIPERRGQIIGLSIAGATTLLLAFEPSYVLLIGARLVAGAGLSLWGLSRMQYMLRMSPLRHRGRVMSLFGGIGRIGTFASPAIGGIVADAFGFGLMFTMAGIAIAAGMIPSILYRESLPIRRKESSSPASPISGLGDILRDQRRDIVTAGIGQIFAATIRSGRGVLIPLYAAFALDLEPTSVGIVVSASAAIDMTLFPLAGYVMDRFGRKFTIVPSFTLFSLGIGLLPLAKDFSTMVLIGLLIGMANGIGSGSMLTLGTDLAPRGRSSEFLGIWRLIGDVGHMGGPLVVGVVADLVGLALAPFFLAGIGVAGVGTFVLFVRETMVRRSVISDSET